MVARTYLICGGEDRGAATVADNHLYYGDNLDILRRYIPTDSVDLIYLDPPFNSQQAYNAFYEEKPGVASSAQVHAFEDTWHWAKAAPTYFAVVEAGGDVSQVLQAFRKLLGENDLLAYLSMMAARLVDLRRVLKSTGSIYLHCDPTASHYLKLLMDAIWGTENFRSEIIWKRTSAHSSANRYGPVHDTLLFYTSTDRFTWNPQYQPYDEQYLAAFYTHNDPDGRRWRRSDLTAAGTRKGSSGQPWRGIDVAAKGNHWKYTIERLEELDATGRIHWPAKANGMPMYKRYLDEMPGVPLQDIWTDIPPLHNLAAERLGYPTQKPAALLDRIVQASSNPGDMVLDPFCGCGTAIASAQRLERLWIGIDITHIAITLIRSRLQHEFPSLPASAYDVTGEPTTLEEARKLAADDKFQFQLWALGQVGARPEQIKKGADQGVDGRMFFHLDDGETRQVVISVKGGSTGPDHVRDLAGVVGRDRAEIGVLVTLNEPTSAMLSEAANHGMYHTAWGDHPRVQILTIRELLEHKRINMPPPSQVNVTFKRAPKAQREAEATQSPLFRAEG
jgi:DNA modification methylase